MRALQLRPNDPVSYRLLPQVLARVAIMAKEMGSEASPEFLQRALLQHFAADDPMMAAFVAVDDGEIVRGHALVTRDQWCDAKPVLTIIQYQLDHAMPIAWLQESMALIEAWAVATGAVSIRAYAYEDDSKRTGPDDADRRRAVAFKRFYGFKEKRVLLERPVKSPGTAALRNPAEEPTTIPAREESCPVPN